MKFIKNKYKFLLLKIILTVQIKLPIRVKIKDVLTQRRAFQ